MRHLILFCVSLLFTFASSSCHAQYIVAHRGASHDAPENTLAAFRLAWEKNADAIEGDFYVTKDNRIVCIHDKTTKRTATGQPVREVAKSTFHELRKLDVGSWKDARYTDERIPLLKEVLAIVPNGKKLFLEVKCGPEIVPLMKPQLEASGLKPDQIVIICFNKEVVLQCRKTMPEYKANWLTSYKENAETHQWLPTPNDVLNTLKQTRSTGLGTKGDVKIVNAEFADLVTSAGFELHIWTVNKVDDAKRFSDLGAVSITTDRPAFIRNGLE